MVLKDWKRDRRSKYAWKNMASWKNDWIVIDKAEDKVGYLVHIYANLNKRYFKTLSEALKFVKNYMETH